MRAADGNGRERERGVDYAQLFIEEVNSNLNKLGKLCVGGYLLAKMKYTPSSAHLAFLLVTPRHFYL